MRVRHGAIRSQRPAKRPSGTDELPAFAVRGPLVPGRVLALQRAAGNRAVTELIGREQRSAPSGAPTVMRQPAATGGLVTQDPAPAPVQQLPVYDESVIAGSEPVRAVMGYIRFRDQGQGTLGVTIWPSITEYSVPGVRFVPTRDADGRWSASVTRTWLPGKPHVEAFSPTPGLHGVPSSSGSDTYLYFGKAAADRVDEGEREHVRDILYAWTAVSSILDEALSRVMQLRPPTAPTQDEAVRGAQAWLRQALPPKLRWPLSTGVSMGMIQAMTALGTTSWRRDDKWHKLAAHWLTVPEKRELNLPVASPIREVVDEGHEIGAHPTAELITAKWSALPSLD
jgi:hypothetical protein